MTKTALQNDAAPNVSIDPIGMISGEIEAEEKRRMEQQRQLQSAHIGSLTETITPWGDRHRDDLS